MKEFQMKEFQMKEFQMNDVDAEGRTGSSAGTTPEPEMKTVPVVEKERVFIGTGLFWGLVVGVLLAVVMIVLAAQNTKRTTIRFLGCVLRLSSPRRVHREMNQVWSSLH